MGGALLVFDAHTTNAVVAQHVKNFEVRTAGVTEHDVDPFKLQAAGQDLGATHGARALFRLDIG